MPAECPVISKKTGHLFEKSLITKHITTHGTCPVTNTEMSLADLIEVRKDNENITLSMPRNVNSVSIPGMLSEFQNDWDQLLVETSLLRKEYDDTRKELAHSMYQNDASTRVIANLLRERDSTREELTKYQNEFGKFEDVADVLGDEYNNMGISQYLVNNITDMSYKLSSVRKLRKIPEIKRLGNLKITSSAFPFGKNNMSLTCCDVNSAREIILGTADGQIAFYSSTSLDKLISLKLHKRKINEIQFYPNDDILAFASCSDDATAGFFMKSKKEEKFEERYRIKNAHNDSITGFSFHPLQEYAILASLDSNWSFHNMLKVKILNYRE